jgi:Gnt-I system high-affinity gluconate transporter
MVTGFIIGIPLFYNVGFVLMIPLIFSIVYQYKLPAVYTGVPMLAALSVTHGFLPPHPSPAALVAQFHANMGTTLLYGIVVAIPAIILAGPVFAKTLKHIHAEPLHTFQVKNLDDKDLPGTANSFISSLLPVILLILATLLPYIFQEPGRTQEWISFFSDPVIVMLISLGVATFTLWLRRGKGLKLVMAKYADAVKDVAMILLIVGGAGALKQVFTDSGVSQQIANALQGWHIQPLVLGWLIAAIIRICIGSATVAGLTTAGIIAPIVTQSGVNPSLMVLSIGAGSLFFSHVNDAGFWLFKEYFNLSIKDTIRSWSIMETIVSIVGLIAVLILNSFIH